MGNGYCDIVHARRPCGCLNFFTRRLVVAFAFGPVVNDQLDPQSGCLGDLVSGDLRGGIDAIGDFAEHVRHPSANPLITDRKASP